METHPATLFEALGSTPGFLTIIAFISYAVCAYEIRRGNSRKRMLAILAVSLFTAILGSAYVKTYTSGVWTGDDNHIEIVRDFEEVGEGIRVGDITYEEFDHITGPVNEPVFFIVTKADDLFPVPVIRKGDRLVKITTSYIYLTRTEED